METDTNRAALVRLASLAAAIFPTATAYGQQVSRLAQEETGGFMPWLIAIGIGVVIFLPAFLNPKRSHLS